MVTRTFYLVSADAKQAQTLVRTMTKTKDLHVDERLNLLVMRDSPEVIRMVERRGRKLYLQRHAREPARFHRQPAGGGAPERNEWIDEPARQPAHSGPQSRKGPRAIGQQTTGVH